jgi:hypothetical protein
VLGQLGSKYKWIVSENYSLFVPFAANTYTIMYEEKGRSSGSIPVFGGGDGGIESVIYAAGRSSYSMYERLQL